MLPLPTWLLTVMSPPINRASWREMARPNPVPTPDLRPVLVCSKCWKSRSSSSADMPGPVSSISACRRNPSDFPGCARTRKATPPRSVNLTALPRRLMRIWRSFPSSPRTNCGTWPMRSSVNCKFFASVRIRKSRSKSSMIVWRSKFAGFRATRPASILDISKMSLISASRCSPLRLMVPRWCF